MGGSSEGYNEKWNSLKILLRLLLQLGSASSQNSALDRIAFDAELESFIRTANQLVPLWDSYRWWDALEVLLLDRPPQDASTHGLWRRTLEITIHDLANWNEHPFKHDALLASSASAIRYIRDIPPLLQRWDSHEMACCAIESIAKLYASQYQAGHIMSIAEHVDDATLRAFRFGFYHARFVESDRVRYFALMAKRVHSVVEQNPWPNADRFRHKFQNFWEVHSP